MVKILDNETEIENESLVGSIEIIDDDLEEGSREIADLFHASLMTT